jgi:hypothetical protein
MDADTPLARLRRLLTEKRLKTGKSRPAKGDEKVFCRSCNQHYLRSSLIRRSWSSPGMRRRDGGRTGARREVWRCCPKGHRLILVGMRVS